MRKHRQRIILIIFAVVALAILFVFKFNLGYFSFNPLPRESGYWGITYSKKFASALGLNWQDTYTAILDDLQVKQVRIPVYWDNIEDIEGNFNFYDYDWILDEGAKRGVQYVLVIGRRLPRWPECHTPMWTKDLPEHEVQIRILREIRMIVERYRNRPEVAIWQVENEPLLDSFGQCPKSDPEFLAEEVRLVRSLDTKPIMITGSGELSDWKREAALGDYFGSTLYRTVWNPFFGYLHYPWPPSLYFAKAQNAGLNPSQMIVAELQAEPWAPNSTLDKLPIGESNKSFTPDDFKSNLSYAHDTNFSRVYLWGVEWWYLQKRRGITAYWDIAKSLKW
ncbi:MAG: hypothetical protein WCO55_00470 [Candidatus Falkowbacteria bacterium]